MNERKKYLNISILGGQIKLVAFDNTERRKENKQAPHFKGDGVAVWVNEIKDKEEKEDIKEETLL